MPTLPTTSPNGQARAQTLNDRPRPEVTPTSLVTFLSHGRVLIVGAEPDARAAAQRLDKDLVATLYVPGETSPATETADGLAIIRGPLPLLAGRLGHFSLTLADTSSDDAPAADVIGKARFDLVLDLMDPPLLEREVLPLGYYAPRGDAEALDSGIETLADMRGEFEKPKFFNYDPDICAHGRSGIAGCTRCLDACPTGAITSLGDLVSVDSHLCQGGGSCATVCPTGAITYGFPTVSDLLAHVRGVLASYRDAGGQDPVLVFFDSTSAGTMAGDLGHALPENALPLEVEEVGSVGLDAWLTCLAYGAGRVIVLGSPQTPPRIRDALDTQAAIAAAILKGMSYPQALICVHSSDQHDDVVASAASPGIASLSRPARFAAPNEKRPLLRLAINHLHDQATARRKLVPLPAGAPFGQVKVDPKACTLCMSCVSVCPTSALRDGQGLPQLNFLEWSCVQCGLCETACPEDAITLDARLIYDDEQRGNPRTLHEEQPFCCIACGKPFATQSMLEVMSRKLEGHWMFQTEEARRRLKMCDTCRVKDMMRAKDPGGPVAPG